MSFEELQQKINTTWMAEAIEVLKPGLVLYGYCSGYFGRDSYSDKTIRSVKIVSPEYKAPYLHLEIEEDGVLDYAQFTEASEVANVIASSNSRMKEEMEEEGYYD